MDEGSTGGVGGQSAASDLRGSITPSALASDSVVLDDDPSQSTQLEGGASAGLRENDAVPARPQRSHAPVRAESFHVFPSCSGDLVSVEKSLKFHVTPLHRE